MTISYPLTMPTTGIEQIDIQMDVAAGVNTSPFTFQDQVYLHQGGRWRATVTLTYMERANAEEWISFIASLNGPYGTFLMGDPTADDPRGVVSGSPLVNGADQTGLTLDIDGLPATTSGVFLAGDYIQLGTGSNSRLYKVVADADSNGSGEATLDIWPRLRMSPGNNDAVIYSSPVGLWRLNSNSTGYTYTPDPDLATMSFEAVEKVTA